MLGPLTGRLDERSLRRLTRLRNRDLPALRRLDRTAAAYRERARTVRTFDHWAEQRHVTEQVREALTASRIEHVAVPGMHGSVTCLAIDRDDATRAWTALAARLGEREWAVDLGGRAPAALTDCAGTSAVTALVHRLLQAPGGEPLGGPAAGCRLEFWAVRPGGGPRPGGGSYPPGARVSPRDNGVLDHLSAASWQAAVAAPNRWVRDPEPPSVLEVREPVDVVYTWVDGADPAWLQRRAQAGDAAALHASAAGDSRFRSRDELRYSLRSVAMFASWVRRIFLVTDGQVPSWLDTADGRVTVVDHRDVFTDPSVLPVFNSHAIESQLHHIDGLAEQYLYFNDDFFLGAPVTPEHFFHGNGVARFFPSRRTVDVEPPSPSDLPVLAAAKRNRELLEAEFGVTVARRLQHTPQPQLRSVLQEMERRHPEVFDRVAGSRLRHPDDVSIPSALAHWYAYELGRAVPGTIRYAYQDIGRPDTERRLMNLAHARDAEVFCLNDVDSDPATFEAQQALLEGFLRRYFPVAAPWER